MIECCDSLINFRRKIIIYISGKVCYCFWKLSIIVIIIKWSQISFELLLRLCVYWREILLDRYYSIKIVRLIGSKNDRMLSLIYCLRSMNYAPYIMKGI